MRLRRIAKWAGFSLLGLFLLVVAGGGGLYLYLRTSLPQTDGTLELAGLTAAVTVTRDRFGIPTIRAQNEHDADFALGFVHAQDRMFEMDMLRRYGEGRIAEWAGKSELGRDELMRTLGIGHASQRDFAGLSQPVQQALNAYAQGVNAYIAGLQHGWGAKPLFYYFIPGPEKWRAVDTLVVAKVLALYLTQNLQKELLHAALLARLPKAAVTKLFPQYPKDGLVTLAQLAPELRGLRLDRLAALLPPTIGQSEASNDWVVNGARSTTGRPILANDPHLLYSAPSFWYLARLVLPNLDLTGGTIPGAPLFVVGHNGHLGWGLTETGGDAEDTFLEKVDPDDPDKYLTPNGGEPFVTRRETIRVKGEKDVTITVRSTRHGPVISDVLDTAKPATPPGGYVLALEATFLQPQDRTMQAFWEMNRATDWPQFEQATQNYVAPQMNMVVAETGGTVAFTAPGRIPIRKNGYGWMPHPGWTGEYDWTGYIPFDKLPRAVNPPSGRFISANNKIVPDNYPFFISSDWAPPYRADRIAQLLDAEAKQSLESTKQIQADTVSLAARQLMPLMLQAKPLDADSAEAEKLLNSWDGNMKADLAAPLIYTAWLRAFERDLFAPELGPDFERFWAPHAVLVHRLLSGEAEGCVDADCPQLLAKSLQAAMGELRQRLGTDIAGWRWGQLHQAHFWSVVSRAPLLGGLLSQSVPVGGGQYTIDAGYMKFTEAWHPYRADTGPGLRMILDVSDLSNSRFIIAPGISGNILSPHYADLLQRWREFRYIAIAREKPEHTLQLEPVRGR